MYKKILADKNILKYFPELETVFELTKPESDCTRCAENAYKAMCELRILQSGVQKEDLINYFNQDYAKLKVTPKGILGFANSILRRNTAKLRGEDIMLDEASYFKRLAKCRKCPIMKKGICTECTCPIHEKAKRATDSCPLDLWDKNL